MIVEERRESGRDNGKVGFFPLYGFSRNLK